MVLSNLNHEALAAASRYYALPSLVLTPKFEELNTRLDLVNTTSNLVTCQGRCKNNGQCSQRLDQHRVARKVLELVIVALGGEEGLEEGLRSVYLGLLCGSAGHQTEAQVEGSVKKAENVVVAWRKTWGIGAGEEVDEEGCKNCVELQIALAEQEDEADEVIQERDQLRQRVGQLEQEAGKDLALRERLQKKASKEQKRAQAAEDQAQDLSEQLQTLQIKYDGLVGRMQEEVNMAKTPSPSPSIPSTKKAAAAAAATASGKVETPATPVFQFQSGPSRQQGMGMMTPQATPEKTSMNGEASSPCSRPTHKRGVTAPGSRPGSPSPASTPAPAPASATAVKQEGHASSKAEAKKTKKPAEVPFGLAVRAKRS